MFIGVPSVIFDTDIKRRSIYGKAGCFRHTKYGCEYRVLSGFFLSDDKLTEWAFNQMLVAIDYLNNNGIDYIQADMDIITESINNGNVELALTLIEKYNINLNYK